MDNYTIVSTPAVVESAALRATTEAANPWLGEVLRPSPEPVTAEWDRAESGPGRDVLVLRLSDPVGTASAVIAPAELADRANAEGRFSRLYSELLRRGTRVLVQRLIGSRSEPAGGE